MGAYEEAVKEKYRFFSFRRRNVHLVNKWKTASCVVKLHKNFFDVHTYYLKNFYLFS
jgi:hypothetical protein